MGRTFVEYLPELPDEVYDPMVEHHSPDLAIDDRTCRVMAGVLATSAVDLAEN
jgi:hypothetical protein